MNERKMFATRINPGLQKALKLLSVEIEKSIADLSDEAFKDLLRKYGKQIPNEQVKK
jgi:hypothetical protein